MFSIVSVCFGFGVGGCFWMDDHPPFLPQGNIVNVGLLAGRLLFLVLLYAGSF